MSTRPRMKISDIPSVTRTSMNDVSSECQNEGLFKNIVCSCEELSMIVSRDVLVYANDCEQEMSMCLGKEKMETGSKCPGRGRACDSCVAWV